MLIFGETIITPPFSVYFSYRKDQHALVKAQLPLILKYCDTQDHEEFVRLCNPEYSKKQIN